nr:MAG: hypothetical protein [Porcellio scaber clopovirus]
MAKKTATSSSLASIPKKKKLSQRESRNSFASRIPTTEEEVLIFGKDGRNNDSTKGSATSSLAPTPKKKKLSISDSRMGGASRIPTTEEERLIFGKGYRNHDLTKGPAKLSISDSRMGGASRIPTTEEERLIFGKGYRNYDLTKGPATSSSLAHTPKKKKLSISDSRMGCASRTPTTEEERLIFGKGYRNHDLTKGPAKLSISDSRMGGASRIPTTEEERLIFGKGYRNYDLTKGPATSSSLAHTPKKKKLSISDSRMGCASRIPTTEEERLIFGKGYRNHDLTKGPATSSSLAPTPKKKKLSISESRMGCASRIPTTEEERLIFGKGYRNYDLTKGPATSSSLAPTPKRRNYPYRIVVWVALREYQRRKKRG